MVPDTSLSIREGAIAAWPGAWQGANLRSIVSGLGIDVDAPWRTLSAKDRDWLLFTDERPKVLVKPERDRIDHGYYGLFWSARAHVHHVLATSKSQMMRDKTTDVAVRICGDLVSRVQVLLDLGLGYLSLGRSSTTLSPGEAQRVRIATQLRSGLFGVVYVLDEPSAGLHPVDIALLVRQLHRLVDAGNTVVLVEHDLDAIASADWVIDWVRVGAAQAGAWLAAAGPADD